MQSRNGGWAAFDKDNTSRLPALLPFCDFGEMIDPPSADVTGHVIEMLGAFGLEGRHPAVARGLRYLYAQQEKEGSWFGRWGVNHVYGTGAVLPGLAAVGDYMDSLAVRRGMRWLLERQLPDGDWEEESFTGCGFPGYGTGEERGARIFEGRELSAGFMIRYHLYRNCFPLLALGRYRAALGAAGRGSPNGRRY